MFSLRSNQQKHRSSSSKRRCWAADEKSGKLRQRPYRKGHYGITIVRQPTIQPQEPICIAGGLGDLRTIRSRGPKIQPSEDTGSKYRMADLVGRRGRCHLRSKPTGVVFLWGVHPRAPYPSAHLHCSAPAVRLPSCNAGSS
jgi:hypothetical protein